MEVQLRLSKETSAALSHFFYKKVKKKLKFFAYASDTRYGDILHVLFNVSNIVGYEASLSCKLDYF